LDGAVSPFIELELLKKILVESRKLGTLNVTFSGGEPFLYPHWKEATKVARQLHMSVRFITNGYLIDRHVAKLLGMYKVTRIDISLYSLSPRVHDKITSIPGSLEKSMRAIELLKEYKVQVGIKATIIKENIDSYDELEAWAHKNGFPIAYDFTITPIIGASKKNSRKEDLNIDFSQKIEFAIKRKRYSGLKTKNKKRVTLAEEKKIKDYAIQCGAGRWSLLFLPTGEVMPCVEWHLICGNVKNTSLEAIWHHSEQLNAIRNAKKSELKYCGTCQYYDSCMHCPGLIDQQVGDFLSCSYLVRERAKVFHFVKQSEEKP